MGREARLGHPPRPGDQLHRTARRVFVNADEFRRVTVRDNETGEETTRDYLPNLTTESECLADAFTLAMGEGRWEL